jgi:hypothetical protein
MSVSTKPGEGVEDELGEGLGVPAEHSSKKNKSLYPYEINGDVSGMSSVQKFHTSPEITLEQSML